MGDTIEDMCTVDRLLYQIAFTGPAEQIMGKCVSQIRIGKGAVACTENIIQDLTTNTTTLIVNKNELMNGEWKCDHGTYIGSDNLEQIT
jgi:hypothetical protein